MPYQKIAIFSLIFLSAVFEITVFGVLSPGRLAPNIVLAVLIIFSCRRNFESLWLWAILAGVLIDLMTFSPVGISAASFLIIIYGVGFVAKRFFVLEKGGGFLISLVMVIGGALGHHLITTGLSILSGYMTPGSNDLSHLVNPQIIAIKLSATFFAFLIIYWPVNKIRNIFFRQENKYSIK